MKFSSPWFSVFAFYLLFVCGELIYYMIYGVDYPYLGQAIVDTIISFSLPICFWLVLVFYSKRGNRVKNHVQSQQYDGCSISIKRATIGLIVSIFILLLLGVKNGINPLVDPLSFRQIIQGGGNSYFLLLFLFFYKLYGVCYLERIYFKTAKIRYHFLTLSVVLFCFVSGFTSLFIHMFLAGLVYLNVRYSFRVVRPSIVFSFLALVVVTPFYTVVRELKKNGIEVNMSVVTDKLAQMDVDPFRIFVDRFDYFDNFVVGSHFARMHQDWTKILDFFYQPLPRSLFPDKAYNFSTTMTGYVYPSNLDIGVTANFGFINEFILYFGDYGPLFAGLFLTFLTVVTYKFFLRANHHGRSATYYSVVLLPYFMCFPIGYFNDMGLPAFILNSIFWYFFAKNTNKQSTNSQLVAQSS